MTITSAEERISASFKAQGLMATLGAITSIVDSACGYAALTLAPADCEVVSAEFKINLLRPGIGERFLAIGRVQNAGKLLTVCTGEVQAFAGSAHKVIALMQATMVNVRA